MLGELKKLFKKEKPDRGKLAEEALIILLLLSAAMMFSGLLLSIWQPKGLAALLAMTGGFVAFLSLAGLVLLWFVREGFK